MPPQQENFWLEVVAGGAFLASVLTLFVLGQRRASGVPLLRWEPRRPVPWGASGAILAMLMVGLALLSFAIPPEEKKDEPTITAPQLIVQPLAMTLLVGGALFVLSRGNREDMGLPANGRELLCDIKIGVVAWLAAIVPVYGIRIGVYFLWLKLWGEPTQHPLIDTLLEKPDPIFLAAAFVTAVLLAPLMEEISFRLLLQGWLEKVAAGQEIETPTEVLEETDYRGPLAPHSVARAPLLHPHEGEGNEEAAPHQGEGNQRAWPIVVSAVLFAVAHIGHGPDPIPLFFLALILGYVYRQTHRILPCMVTHALFNLLSLAMLALMLRQVAPVPVP